MSNLRVARRLTIACAALISAAFCSSAFAAVVEDASSAIGFVSDEPERNAAETPVDESDVRLLAATAWAEARSEGEPGMRAVAHVIVNRIRADFGANIESVILAPWQFSAWNEHDPNRPLAQNPEAYAVEGRNLETWEAAQRVAREVLSGQSVDPTDGALFYHTRAVRPRWARLGEGRRVIGAHVFYRDVRDGSVRRARLIEVAARFEEALPIEEPEGDQIASSARSPSQ